MPVVTDGETKKVQEVRQPGRGATEEETSSLPLHQTGLRLEVPEAIHSKGRLMRQI
jgi:hypothetical protein